MDVEGSIAFSYSVPGTGGATTPMAYSAKVFYVPVAISFLSFLTRTSALATPARWEDSGVRISPIAA